MIYGSTQFQSKVPQAFEWTWQANSKIYKEEQRTKGVKTPPEKDLEVGIALAVIKTCYNPLTINTVWYWEGNKLTNLTNKETQKQTKKHIETWFMTELALQNNEKRYILQQTFP